MVGSTIDGRTPRRYAIAVKRQQLRGLSHLSVHQASEALDVTRKTVRKWRRRLHNPDYLKVGKPSGRQWKLPLEARQFLVDLVQQPATLYGFEDPMWTSRKVATMIDRKFNIQLSRVTAWNYLRRSNLTPQKPGTLYREQDPAKVAKWLTTDLPAITHYAAKHNAIIYWQDETGVAISAPVTRTWGTRGQTPTLRVTGKKGGICVLGSVSNEGTAHHMTHEGTAEQDTVYAYLLSLKAQHPDREVIVIMDNAPSHTARGLRDRIATVRGLYVRYLPPYSPELNPAEKLWRHLKRNKLRHHQARTRAQLRTLVDGHMHWIGRDRKFLLDITSDFRGSPAAP